MTKYWMALNSVSGVGPKTARMLVNRFGSPDKVFSAPVIEIARMPRLDLLLARQIVGAGEGLAEFEKLITRLSETGIQVLCPDSCEYPDLLKITEDFPPILYRRGEKLPKAEPTVAIVGTRSPTLNGIKAAERMAERLASNGIAVVSGLAYGIDTAAHRGTLAGNGKTIAALGSGLRAIYPRENRQLADEISINGSIISECHPNEIVSSQRLIQRNRIISGISLGLILVEPRQGALNAAEQALKQNRQVFIYKTDSSVLPDSLSESLSTIYEIDELDAVLDHLHMEENRDSQMRLL